MKSRMKAIMAAGLLMVLGPMTAQATLITVIPDFEAGDFPNPDWAAFLVFDDSTGVPWSLNSAVTIYDVYAMLLTDGIAIYDETELYTCSTPDTCGVVVDVVGRVALFLAGRDFDTGRSFGASLSGFGGPGRATTILSSNTGTFPNFTDVSFSDYLAFVPVPEPTTLALLGLGLVGMGLRRRKVA